MLALQLIIEHELHEDLEYAYSVLGNCSRKLGDIKMANEYFIKQFNICNGKKKLIRSRLGFVIK